MPVRICQALFVSSETGLDPHGLNGHRVTTLQRRHPPPLLLGVLSQQERSCSEYPEGLMEMCLGTME